MPGWKVMVSVFVAVLLLSEVERNVMHRYGKQRLAGLWGRDGAGEWGN